MNVQDYRQAGFNLSIQIEQAVIDRAEADIKQCYLLPLVGSAEVDLETGNFRDTLSNLAYLLILQRSIAGTRAGAKQKQTAQSAEVSRWEIGSQQATVCAEKLQICAESVGVQKPWRVCKDICGIFYKTQILGY